MNSNSTNSDGGQLQSFFKSPTGDLVGKGVLRHEINNNNNSPGLLSNSNNSSASYNEYQHLQQQQQQHRYGGTLELSHHQHQFHNHHQQQQQQRSSSMSALSLSAYQQQHSNHHQQMHPYQHNNQHQHPGKMLSGSFNLYPDAAGYSSAGLYGGGSAGISQESAPSFGGYYAEYADHLGSGMTSASSSGNSGGPLNSLAGYAAVAAAAAAATTSHGGNDLDIDFDSVCPGQSAMLECDVDQVIRHELSVDGSLDFASLLPAHISPPSPAHSPSLPHLTPLASYPNPHSYSPNDDDELEAQTNGAVSSFTTTSTTTTTTTTTMNATPSTPSTTSIHSSQNMPFTMPTTEQQLEGSSGGREIGERQGQLHQLVMMPVNTSSPSSSTTTFYGPSRPETSTGLSAHGYQQQYVTLTSPVSNKNSNNNNNSGYSLLQRQLSLGSGSGADTFIGTSSPSTQPPSRALFSSANSPGEGDGGNFHYGSYFSSSSSPNDRSTSNYHLNSSDGAAGGGGGADIVYLGGNSPYANNNNLANVSSVSSGETASVASVTSSGAVGVAAAVSGVVVSPHHHQTPSSWVH